MLTWTRYVVSHLIGIREPFRPNNYSPYDIVISAIRPFQTSRHQQHWSPPSDSLRTNVTSIFYGRESGNQTPSVGKFPTPSKEEDWYWSGAVGIPVRAVCFFGAIRFRTQQIHLSFTGARTIRQVSPLSFSAVRLERPRLGQLGGLEAGAALPVTGTGFKVIALRGDRSADGRCGNVPSTQMKSSTQQVAPANTGGVSPTSTPRLCHSESEALDVRHERSVRT